MNIPNVTLFVCAAFVLCLAGCGGPESTEERLVREYDELVYELGTICQSITDDDSASAACRPLTDVARELTKIKSDLLEHFYVSNEIGPARDEMINSSLEAHAYIDTLAERMKENPKVPLILGQALERVKESLVVRPKRPPPGEL